MATRAQVREAAPERLILTTMWTTGCPEYENATRLVDARRHSLIAFWFECWKRTRHADCLIINGAIGANGLYRDVVAGILTRLHRRRPAIVVADATWQPESKAIARRLGKFGLTGKSLSKLMIRLLDGQRVIYCVLSSAEVEIFSQTWGVPKSRVRFTPFCYTTHRKHPETSDVYVFAGGDSLRDHALVEQIARVSTHKFVLASRTFTPQSPPPNLEVVCLEPDDFENKMLNSSCVLVSLQENTVRSAGQQTYLNAMKMGIPVVVPAALGVTDYVNDGVDGFVMPRDPVQISQAIDRSISEMASFSGYSLRVAAERHVEEFSPHNYWGRLASVASQAAGVWEKT